MSQQPNPATHSNPAPRTTRSGPAHQQAALSETALSETAAFETAGTPWSNTGSPHYLDFARFGPPPPAVRDALLDAVRLSATGAPGVVDELHDRENAAADIAARLTGFDRAGVTLVPSTSAGLFHVAFGLDGPGRVLVPRHDFPANVYPWLRAQERGGLTVDFLDNPDGHTSPERVAAALRPDTVAVTVSAVDYRTGRRADLPALREVIGDRLLVVDAIQGFGVSDQPWNLADVVVAGGQKWLRSGWGAALFAASPRALDRLSDGLTGWSGVEDRAVFDATEHPALADAGRVTMTMLNPLAITGLLASLTELERTGQHAVAEAVTANADLLVERLLSTGADLLTPAEPQHRAGIVSVRLAEPRWTAVTERLRELGVVATARPGYLRFSVHSDTPAGTIALATS
ncbi:aminotransferase class V-fold PLP-dependent enzyme [Allokutzneria sp. A3M-2-11 16]|uniref:aminotransferase class V-fold PLP-dependent enzyme n=1 Tax=Allokutzneria sp. A3M-2-11 16 TaxID=2962043 RepID=UPI0020B8568A|nr:aminotransferase class V-fold PLP-dependent enzyme [Allokutzneria sp. A3M-2-11 16]MCP3804221.1 aminotransferase class V-fold PLP-dependent enzyme [Allokutzneria sp. A3M-2-11 16]